MSLSFHNSRKCSRRPSRSRSRAKHSFKSTNLEFTNRYFNKDYDDDFPPLKHSLAYRECAYETNNTLDLNFAHSNVNIAKYNNFLSIDKNDEKSFEELRWNDYEVVLQRPKALRKNYSQCLIKNKLCCQRNQSSAQSQRQFNNLFTINEKPSRTICMEDTPDSSIAKFCFTPHKESVGNFSINKQPLLDFKFTTPLSTCCNIENRDNVPCNLLYSSPLNASLKRSHENFGCTNLLATKCSNLSFNFGKPTDNCINKTNPVLFNTTFKIQNLDSNSNYRTKSFEDDKPKRFDLFVGSADEKKVFSKNEFGLKTSASGVNILHRCHNVSRSLNLNESVSLSKMEPRNFLLSKIGESSTNLNEKPIKERSIHTINEPLPLPSFQNLNFSANKISSACENSPQIRFETLLPSNQASLFPNTTWFLQENLSDQFGFNSTLSSINPLFVEGNLYAECYDYSTVALELFKTIMPKDNPVLNQKKDFQTLFSPYLKDHSLFRRSYFSNILF